MKITMFGTGNANAVDCYNTCFMLTENNKNFLVDAGGGNQILSKLKKHEVNICDIHDIFLTHEHLDHLIGVLWLIRIIGQKINQGKYTGNLNIYCHDELAEKLMKMSEMTIQKKVCRYFGDKIIFNIVNDGEERNIIDCAVTFFDIKSQKAKQYGFMLKTLSGKVLTCLGDEPYRDCEEMYVKNCDLLMHEAYCLYTTRDKFRPYEKFHCTVKEACDTAEKENVKSIIIYHTEDTNLPARKELYTNEGKLYYSGKIYVPDDDESYII